MHGDELLELGTSIDYTMVRSQHKLQEFSDRPSGNTLRKLCQNTTYAQWGEPPTKVHKRTCTNPAIFAPKYSP